MFSAVCVFMNTKLKEEENVVNANAAYLDASPFSVHYLETCL